MCRPTPKKNLRFRVAKPKIPSHKVKFKCIHSIEIFQFFAFPEQPKNTEPAEKQPLHIHIS